VTFEGSSAVLQVEIADDEESRQRGLMGRKLLPPGHGMAFVWDEPTTATFWMKDVSIPLSIAFVDAGGRITSILDMEPCASEPCPRYAADAPYVLAIETNQGWFAEHRIAVGRTAELQVNAGE
jgi:hypothetical protein